MAQVSKHGAGPGVAIGAIVLATDCFDRFLAGVLPGQSRSHVQRLIKDGHVRVGEREARPNTPVKEGDAIVADVPPPAPTELVPEALPLPVRSNSVPIPLTCTSPAIV